MVGRGAARQTRTVRPHGGISWWSATGTCETCCREKVLHRRPPQTSEWERTCRYSRLFLSCLGSIKKVVVFIVETGFIVVLSERNLVKLWNVTILSPRPVGVCGTA